MLPHGLVRWIIRGSLALIAFGWWRLDALPAPDQLASPVAQAPRQQPLQDPPFEVTAKGVNYLIQPRYSYEMDAVVVSLHQSDAWWDSAHEQWNDHINLLDVCVVWGGSATSGAYRQVSFSNTQFECYWSWRGEVPFDNAEASNVHLVTADPALGKRLKALRVGDQIRLSGQLVNYTTRKDGQTLGTRVSSAVRTDSGPGACEVLYVSEARLLARPNRRGLRMLQAGLVLLLGSVVCWFCLPVRVRD